MRTTKKRAKPSKNQIRDWTLYVLRFKGNFYYVGITSRKDFMRRVQKHGSVAGARWNRNRTVEEIVEIQHLGRMPRIKAENIENDITLEYRKKYGITKVRGGYNAFVAPSLIPNYTPGSKQSVIFILACSILSLLILLMIAMQ